MLYRAYVSPKSSEKLYRIEKLAQKYRLEQVAQEKTFSLDDSDDLRLILPQEVENIRLGFYEFGAAVLLKEDVQDRNTLRHTWAVESLEAFSRADKGVVEKLVAYWHFDPGLFLDKIIIRPLLMLSLFFLVLTAMDYCTKLANESTSIFLRPSDFRTYSTRIVSRLLNSRYILRAALLIAFALGIQHYYSYGYNPAHGLGRATLRLSYNFAYGVGAYTLIAVIWSVDKRRSRRSLGTAWRIQCFLIGSTIILAMTGIFVHGPATWETESEVEMMIEAFHYNRFQRLFVDYYTIFGLIVMVALSFIVPRSALEFQLAPRFKDARDFYGFGPFVRFLGVTVPIILLVYMMISLQVVQGREVAESRYTFHALAGQLISLGLIFALGGSILLVATIYTARNKALATLKRELGSLEETTNDEKLQVLKRQIKNAEDLTLWKVISQILAQPKMFIVGIWSIFSTIVAMYTIIKKIFAVLS